MTDSVRELREKIERLEERIRNLEVQESEMEFRLQKLSDVVLTADKMHQKLRSETIRHDF